MNLEYGVSLGYADVLWRSVGDTPSREFLPYSAVEEDEVRWVYIPSWHKFSVGDLCWLLYQPALSYFNGWSQHPEELELSAVVNCEILDFYKPNSRLEKARKTEAEERAFYEAFEVETEKRGINVKARFQLPRASEISGWTQVRCQRVVALAEIPSHFEPRPVDVIFARTPGASESRFESRNLWGELSRIGQECVAEWLVVKSQPPQAIYYSLSIDGGTFEICNGSLPIRA